MKADSRRRTLYALAVLAMVIGYGIALWIGRDMVRGGGGLVLVPAPGAATVELDAGEYTVYHEFAGIANSQLYFQDLLPAGLTVDIRRLPGGEPLRMQGLDVHPVYRFGSRRGAQWMSFTLEEPARLEVTTTFTTDGLSTATMVAIGDGRERRTMRLFTRTLGVTLATTLIAGLLALAGALGAARPPPGD